MAGNTGRPGGQMGNLNGRTGFLWKRAIRDALERREQKFSTDPKKHAEARVALMELAEKLLQSAEAGEIAALKELGDRLDGKAAQQLMLSNPEGGPVETVVRWKSDKDETTP